MKRLLVVTALCLCLVAILEPARAQGPNINTNPGGNYSGQHTGPTGGGLNAPCSPSQGCIAGLVCQNGYCQRFNPAQNQAARFGGEGQACKSGNICNPGLNCVAGTCMRAQRSNSAAKGASPSAYSKPQAAPVAGRAGGPCMRGNACNPGLVCRSSVCRPR